ncbi:hypothetical protein [Legionella shakespearei]|uniref:Uncharacterized protein n=1 Tax=Legionella shakespearei DSM 23087 TaxID=1122169 RepID=A0A0W0YL98_9GAMM|nr:hypothetical protein [Legionella shakespearei]KTD57664.1 hypothetical protein Lsha_2505 [Legionella shakespearei DSM 23087]
MGRGFFLAGSKPSYCLRIYDFDKVITIKPSFEVETDNASVQKNTKKDIKSVLVQPDPIFAICSYLDSPDNIVTYLSLIFRQKPVVVMEKEFKVHSERMKQEIHAFTLTELSFENLPYPVCVTTLPKRTGTVDEKTGEKNSAYKNAREALKESRKNIPMTAIIQYYIERNMLDPHQLRLSFYDDDRSNVDTFLELSIPGLNLSVEGYYVIPDREDFETEKAGFGLVSSRI